MELFLLFSIVRQFPIVSHPSSFLWKLWNAFFCSKIPEIPSLSAFPAVEHPSPSVECILLRCYPTIPGKFLRRRRIFPSLVEYNIHKREFPSSRDFVSIIRQFPAILTIHEHGTFSRQPNERRFFSCHKSSCEFATQQFMVRLPSLWTGRREGC